MCFHFLFTKSAREKQIFLLIYLLSGMYCWTPKFYVCARTSRYICCYRSSAGSFSRKPVIRAFKWHFVRRMEEEFFLCVIHSFWFFCCGAIFLTCNFKHGQMLALLREFSCKASNTRHHHRISRVRKKENYLSTDNSTFSLSLVGVGVVAIKNITKSWLVIAVLHWEWSTVYLTITGRERKMLLL